MCLTADLGLASGGLSSRGHYSSPTRMPPPSWSHPREEGLTGQGQGHGFHPAKVQATLLDFWKLLPSSFERLFWEGGDGLWAKTCCKAYGQFHDGGRSRKLRMWGERRTVDNR